MSVPLTLCCLPRLPRLTWGATRARPPIVVLPFHLVSRITYTDIG